MTFPRITAGQTHNKREKLGVYAHLAPVIVETKGLKGDEMGLSFPHEYR